MIVRLHHVSIFRDEFSQPSTLSIAPSLANFELSDWRPLRIPISKYNHSNLLHHNYFRLTVLQEVLVIRDLVDLVDLELGHGLLQIGDVSLLWGHEDNWVNTLQGESGIVDKDLFNFENDLTDIFIVLVWDLIYNLTKGLFLVLNIFSRDFPQ